MEYLALCIGFDPDSTVSAMGSAGDDRGKFRAGLFGDNDRRHLFLQLAYGFESICIVKK